MATQPEDIVNAALLRIGSKTISSLSDAGEVAETANEIWADQRDLLLERFDWQFAMAKVSLGAAGISAQSYDYVYSLPSNCIRIISLLGSSTYDYTESGSPWEQEANRIHTDQSVAWLLYVKQETSVATYPQAFVEALTARMAWQLSYRLTNNARLRDRMFSENMMAERVAKGFNSRSRKSEDSEPTLWTNFH